MMYLVVVIIINFLANTPHQYSQKLELESSNRQHIFLNYHLLLAPALDQWPGDCPSSEVKKYNCLKLSNSNLTNTGLLCCTMH